MEIFKISLELCTISRAIFEYLLTKDAPNNGRSSNDFPIILFSVIAIPRTHTVHVVKTNKFFHIFTCSRFTRIDCTISS